MRGFEFIPSQDMHMVHVQSSSCALQLMTIGRHFNVRILMKALCMSKPPNWGYAAFSDVVLRTEQCTLYLWIFIHKYAHDIYLMYAKIVSYKKVLWKVYLNGRNLVIIYRANLSNIVFVLSFVNFVLRIIWTAWQLPILSPGIH